MRDLYNHTTAEGEEIPLNQMENSHLVNTIKMFLRVVARSTKALNSKEVELSPAELALYGRKSYNYAGQLKQAHEALMPYVLEATIRGLYNVIGLEVVAAYGRQTLLTLNAQSSSVESKLPNISRHDFTVDDDDDGDDDCLGFADNVYDNNSLKLS
jgi:hypothetical protein